MKATIIRIVKAILFCGLLLCGIGKLGSFFQPIWLEWSNYDRTNGFYKEPHNTIETVFLGSSVVVNGITPIELYEDYGICAYNLSTESQPVLSSYYWLKEAYRLHPDTLSTVVMDASMLRWTPEVVCYQRALDNMAMSGYKVEAVHAYTNEKNEFFNYLFPLNEYHERWTELVSNDFDAPTVCGFLRGYNPSFQFYIDADDYQNLALPSCYLNEESDMRALDGKGLNYLREIIRFCKDKDLNLLIIKTPMAGWDDSCHVAVATLAREYGLDFLDFNFEPLISDIGFDIITDTNDSGHMNYNGASKLTRWIGEYLIEHCGNHDVRNDSRYVFLDDELKVYQSTVVFRDSLCSTTDICGYLQEALAHRGRTVFLSVQDDAAYALLSEQREMLSSLGLNLLSQITFRSSYLAVIEDGKLQMEMIDDNEGSAGCIQFSGRTKDNKAFDIYSGGLKHGNLSSIIIDGEDYSQSQRGINVVVYDYVNNRVLDSSTFDTCFFSTQEPYNPKTALRLAEENSLPYYELPERAKKVWMYNRRYDNSKYESWWNLFCSKDQVFEYLSPYINNKDYTVYIAVQDEAAYSFDDEARSRFRELGLTELARLEYRDSYIGIINDGRVFFEQRDHGDVPITYESVDCRVVSGGCDSGNCSEIFIKDVDYAMHCRGLNIAVYDKALQTVVSKYAFDTCVIPISLSDSQEKRGNVA